MLRSNLTHRRRNLTIPLRRRHHGCVKKPERAPGWVTVYRWKKRYIQEKEDYRALVDRTRLKGNRESRYPSVIIDFCNDAITAKYLRREFSSKQGAFEDALDRVMNENALRPECDALPLPTRRIVDRLISNIPAYDTQCVAPEYEPCLTYWRWPGSLSVLHLTFIDGLTPTSRTEKH
jgi:hypothetical protein